MRRKTFLGRIVYLCLLLLFCLFSFSPFRSVGDREPSAADRTQAPVSSVFNTPESSAAAREIQEAVQQTEQGAPIQTNDYTEQAMPAAVLGSSSETELPEIEIPFVQGESAQGPVSSAAAEPGIEAGTSGGNDVQFFDNGDILLPEVP